MRCNLGLLNVLIHRVPVDGFTISSNRCGVLRCNQLFVGLFMTEITGFEVTIDNPHDVVYVAYQGDVNEFQTVYVTEEPTEEIEELIESHILSTMRACLAGWWATTENQMLADMARHKGKYIAPVHGFVVRVTSQGWRAYDIEYTSDSLSEAVITQLSCDGIEPPVPLPLFFFDAFKKSQ